MGVRLIVDRCSLDSHRGFVGFGSNHADMEWVAAGASRHAATAGFVGSYIAWVAAGRAPAPNENENSEKQEVPDNPPQQSPKEKIHRSG